MCWHALTRKADSSKLEDHTLSAVRYSLVSTLAATVQHIEVAVYSICNPPIDMQIFSIRQQRNTSHSTFCSILYSQPQHRKWRVLSDITKSFIEKYNIQQILANRVIVNPAVGQSGLKYRNSCSQLSTHFKRHMAFRRADESLVCSDKTGTVSWNLHYDVKKQVQLLSLLLINKYIIFL
jgi:hypothetical protein